jgi:5-methylcytosine-specific restriction endonuclease McrA
MISKERMHSQSSCDIEHPTEASMPRTTDPLALPVLVLNRIFQPVRITTVRRAIKLMYTGAATAIDGEGDLVGFGSWLELPVRDGSDDFVQLVNGQLRAPRIIHLRRYAKRRQPQVRLTRRNVMLRDGFQCQYCEKRGPVVDLDIDHVMPRSRGGDDSWTNLVTACQPCNRKKGRRTPVEASMFLLRPPCEPRWSVVVQLLAGTARRYKEWEPFLKAG